MENVGVGQGRISQRLSEIVDITMLFTNSRNVKRKSKRFFSLKKLQKAGGPGDEMRDRALYELVDEI